MTSQEELNAKSRYYFEGYVVDKGLSNRQDIKRVPKFVAEHLLTKISEESDEKTFNKKLMKIIQMVNTLYPEPKDKDRILDRIFRGYSCKIIDEIKVEVDERYGIRKAVIPSLNLRNARIKDSVVDKHEQLLSTGIWGLATLTQSEPILNEKGKPITLPVMVEDFKPFHVNNVDLKEFIENRQYFTLGEWMDVLINTVD